MLYSGWTPEICLAMPAVQFFTMLVRGRAFHVKSQNKMLFSLIDVIAFASTGGENYKTIRAIYTNMLEKDDPIPHADEEGRGVNEPPRKPLTGAAAHNALIGLFGGHHAH